MIKVNGVMKMCIQWFDLYCGFVGVWKIDASAADGWEERE
jgi:hypothetical protein